MKRFLVLVCLFGCSSNNGGGGGDDDVGPDAGSGSSSPVLDANQCAAFAQSMAAAAASCGSALPSGAQAQVESWCRTGVTKAAACGGSPARGLGCFSSPDSTDWVCELGQPYPSCNGDLDAALGAYCLMSSGNPACASVACNYDVDCSGNGACNSVTHQCFQKSAYCIGLPCAYDVDCPSNEKCNSAEGACVGN